MIRYGLLFLPYLLATLLQRDPLLSYFTAWGGSFWIFYLTLSGKVKPLPGGSFLDRQLFRPIGFTQLIYVGYTAVTSIFYVLSLNGLYYFDYSAFDVAVRHQRELAAEAQRYYVLAHAAFSMGVLLFMDYRRSGEWKIQWSGERVWFVLYLAGALTIGAQVLRVIPGLGQVQVRLSELATVASVFSFALSAMRKQPWLVVLTGAIYAVNMYEAFLSGWKGAVLILFILLCVFLYPKYKKTVIAVGPTVLVSLLFFLSVYGSVFRSLNWRGNISSEKAAEIAVNRVADTSMETVKRDTWGLLTGRLSEIGMFVKYIDNVPENRPYYGSSIVWNGALSIIPSAVWPEKPSMERMAMERAYENNITKRSSGVSAKPQFVVDAYLSGGALGVLIACFVFGMLCSFASRLAERWFGGYLIGGGVVYLGMFRIFWLGNSFEFFCNQVFWGFLIMGALFLAGRWLGVLTPRRRPRKVAE
jgi:hypothetical protein